MIDDDIIKLEEQLNDKLKIDRINDYLLSLETDLSNDILDIKKIAIDNFVPIIRYNSLNILKLLLTITNPKKILEIGTGIGYSSMIMNKILKNSQIDTIENYDKRISIAKEIFNKYDTNKNITLYEDDANIILDNLINKNKQYDFIFLDAAKAQYIIWLPKILKLVSKNGIIFTDNVLRDDEVIEHKLSIIKRDRTIHKRLREYLYEITHNDQLYTKIINIDDGISISYKM